MAVNTLGSKYAVKTLSAVGTTTVSVATAAFASGDFGATQRAVGLFTTSNTLTVKPALTLNPGAAVTSVTNSATQTFINTQMKALYTSSAGKSLSFTLSGL